MLKNTVILLSMLSILIASGCSSLTGPNANSNPKCPSAAGCPISSCSPESCQPKPAVKQQMPLVLQQGAKLVAGGLMIEWEVPEDGTCYYIWNGRIVQTKTVTEGDTFEISITPDSTEEIKAAKAIFAIGDLEPIIAELWFKPKQ